MLSCVSCVGNTHHVCFHYITYIVSVHLQVLNAITKHLIVDWNMVSVSYLQ